MDSLKDILVYIIKHYPEKELLSDARLTKTIYLCDWRHTLVKEKQLTDIKWIYNHYGPYVKDVYNLVKNDNNFNVIYTDTIYGNPKTIIKLSNINIKENLTNEAIDTLKFVLEKTKDMLWDEFIKLVYSTYPIISSKKGNSLNLVRFAKEYKFAISQEKSA